MNEFKQVTIANFNCTFGAKDEPLMEHFKDALWPAFNSDIVRAIGSDDKYFFDQVKVIEYEPDKFALVGLLIRSTILEVYSRFEKGKGIKITNQEYPTDPFSIFIIFLNNHRMIYIKNQRKGSPDIRAFSATARHILEKYRIRENENREKGDKIPYAVLNIVNLPSEKDIIEKLEEVKKITKLTFKLYPLNGDIPVDNPFDSVLRELYDVESKTGNIVINSPKRFKKVAELITKTKGIVKPILDVIYINGNPGKIHSNMFSEKLEIPLDPENNFESNVKETIELLKEKPELEDCSEENQKIYNKHLIFLKNVK